MLVNIHIKNLVLIPELDMDFGEGLSVLTGETGAGKSVLMGALSVGLGEKFGKELLRDAEKDGLVELTFLVSDAAEREALEEFSLQTDEENQLILSRRLSPAGRVTNRINDTSVTAAALKNCASVLIDLHAQHEQQSLRRADQHLRIIDGYGGEQTAALLSEVRLRHRALQELLHRREEAVMDEAERAKRMDYLSFQIREINDAAIKPGEDEALEAYYKKAVNGREILSAAEEVYKLVGGGNANSAAELTGRALQQMKRVLGFDNGLEPLFQSLEEAESLLSDFDRDLSSYISGLDFDETALFETEQRLNLINGLKLKFGRTAEEIFAARDAFEEELSRLEDLETYAAELDQKISEAKASLYSVCETLSARRRALAEELSKQVREALAELNFMSVSFKTSFARTEECTERGFDRAVFMISTNVGEPMRPLYEVASGGELSRVMLAIKTCLAGRDDHLTLVFDEIDVGISGVTAQKVAEKLAVIARTHQVLCITHLPQIASMADVHYLIEKHEENKKTVSRIQKLTEEARIEELTRLLAGEKKTQAARDNAAELIRSAAEFRRTLSAV